MKPSILILVAAGGLGLAAQAPLPLSFDLGVHPDARGSLTSAKVEWRWSDSLASRASFSYQSSSSSGDLPGYGEDALYASESVDSSLALEPFVLSGTLAFLDWEAGAGLGLKTEDLEERGSYRSVGTQTYDNVVRGWRIGTPLTGSLAARFGPLDLGLDLAVWPACLYVLSQEQSSTLIAPKGSLDSLCLIGPEIAPELRVSAFGWAWAGVRYEFLWLSTPRLVQNEAGDAWTAVIEGKTNQSLRVLGGLRLPLRAGSVELGVGWRRNSSRIEGGAEAEIDQGLAFELSLSSGR